MAEKNLFINIFHRLGLEPYIFVLIQKLARLHPKVVSGLQLPLKSRDSGIAADTVPVWWFPDPGRSAGSRSKIRIRNAEFCRWGGLKNLWYNLNLTGKRHPLNYTGPLSHLGRQGRAAVYSYSPRSARLFFAQCRLRAKRGKIFSSSFFCCAR
jgi:hypothetical protein